MTRVRPSDVFLAVFEGDNWANVFPTRHLDKNHSSGFRFGSKSSSARQRNAFGATSHEENRGAPLISREARGGVPRLPAPGTPDHRLLPGRAGGFCRVPVLPQGRTELWSCE